MPAIYLDVSDVVQYFTYNMTASGIQRVQLEFIRIFSGNDYSTFEFVIENSGSAGFTIVSRGELMELVEGIDSGSFSRQSLTDLLMQIRSAKDTAKAKPGDTFFVSGAFWASPTALRSLWNAKELGARVGFLCYDLIPIRHPEFCDEGLTKLFTSSFGSICHIVDFIFTISEYVKRDVETYLDENGIKLPVVALPLAHELAPTRTSAKLSERVQAILKRPYVLFVSTIEARKNHVYAFTVWQRLLERSPEIVPDMIWVGRPGWLVQDLMQRVERLHHLDGKLKIINNMSDLELQALYKGSLFSFYPSLAEGWGLPVAESLMFGKPAVVSKTTSLPEVGGDFVWYIDPDNVTEGVNLIERLLTEPHRLDGAARRIREHFKPRLWLDVCRDLVRGFEEIKASAPIPAPLPTVMLRPGLLYPAGSDGTEGCTALSMREMSAMDAVFDPRWYAAEPWGRWMKELASGLRLELPAHEDLREYLVRLDFTMLHRWRGRSLSLHNPASGHEAVFRAVAGKKQSVLARMSLQGGEQTLVLHADRRDRPTDLEPRMFSCGLMAFGFAPCDDADAMRKLEGAAGPSDVLRVRSAQVGSVSRLKPRKVALPDDDWRIHLVTRTISEGPRMAVARTLTRTGRWLSGGRL